MSSEPPSGPPDSRGYTIDELARATGMTVRNIRAHQARGLLPPPDVHGRTGYYGQEHVDRLELIVDLQADGLNLAAIRRVLEDAPLGLAGEALGMRRLLLEPWEEETPQVMTAEELLSRIPSDRPDGLERAQRLGVVADLGGGRVEVRSPSLIGAAEELVGMGIPLGAVLDVAERVARHADGIARSFVQLIEEQVWQPFEEAGRPDERWPRVRELVERARPLALVAVNAAVRRSMAQAIERAFARRIVQAGRPSRG